MIIVRNNIIPFKGFKAMYFFGILFVRKDCVMTASSMNHEKIHDAQAKEMLFIFFYLWYVIEWVIRLFMKGNAYRNISFEREAYSNQANLLYVQYHRKHYAFIKYLKK